MNRDDVLRRVKKCMAMGASPNEHEAAAALRQAQKLMTLHGVTEADVLAAEITAESVKSLTATRNPAGWEMHLASLLSGAFSLERYLKRGYCYIPPKPHPRKIVLAEWVYIGPTDRAVMAAYAHTVLGRQVIKARDRYLAEGDFITRAEKIRAGESFCEGFISNVQRQINFIALDKPLQDAAKALLTQHLGVDPGTVKAPSRGFSPDAYADGLAEGRNAYLNKPMPGAPTTARLK